MKFLLDENIPMSLKKILLNKGHDVEHVNQNLKGKSDREVFDYAVKNKRCMITYDFDFNEMKKEKHYGIIKIDRITENHQSKLIEVIEKNSKDGLEDIYIHIGKNNIYKELKKYSKKTHKFKQFQRIPIEVL